MTPGSPTPAPGSSGVPTLGVGGPLIIVGASTRAAAQSAIRAGFEPWCIDLFADRDLKAIAHAERCENYPAGILAAVERAPVAPVVYTGALENRPDILEGIALNRPLRGCDADAVRSVRDPKALATLAPFPGLRRCKVLLSVPLLTRIGMMLRRLAGREERFLVKPRASAGGANIRPWSPGKPLRETEYLQQFIEGTPISAIYHAHGWSARFIGASQQFIGDPSLGAKDFQYCGGLAPLPLDDRARHALTHLGVALAQRHSLRGVFGVDLILDASGDLWPVEVNPRYTASVELFERLDPNLAVFAEHPAISPEPVKIVSGKAIAFARADATIPDLYEVFGRAEVADVPEIGEKIPRGRPICTLFASEASRAACVARLHEMAERLYTRLSP